MEIEGLTDINVLCANYRRLRKKGKPVERVVEALNKLGARRPTKQRFSLSYKSDEGVLTLVAKSTEFLPDDLRRIADQLVLPTEPTTTEATT